MLTDTEGPAAEQSFTARKTDNESSSSSSSSPKQVPAMTMGLLPSWRLWVGMLAAMVVMAEFPRTQQKCIFDEVQAQTRVVRASPNQPRLRPQARQRPNPAARRDSPLRGLQFRERRALRTVAPPISASQQPIRIRRWFCRERSNLSEAEKERLEAVMEEAVRVVSSLLSGDKCNTHTHTLTHTKMSVSHKHS